MIGAEGAVDLDGDGHVEVYRRATSGWDLIDEWDSPDGGGDGFGAQVALWGNVGLVSQVSTLPTPKVFVYEIPPVDRDGDGFADDVDCADRQVDVFPGAVEACNQLDDDCDESVDEGCPADPEPDTADTGAVMETADTASSPPPGGEGDDGNGCGCGSEVHPTILAVLVTVARARRRRP